VIHCPACAKNVEPQVDIGNAPDAQGNASRKMVPLYLCPTCEAFLGKVEDGQQTVLTASEKSTEPATFVKHIAKPAAVIPIRNAAPMNAPPPGSLLEHCRQRLSVVEAEIATRNELITEAKQLRAMIRAAERVCKQS
jgi:hypothetical protein